MNRRLVSAVAIAAVLLAPTAFAADDTAAPWPFDDLQSGPTLRVTRCDEERIVGELLGRGAESISLRADSGPVSIPLSDVCGVEERHSQAGGGFLWGTALSVVTAAGLVTVIATDGGAEMNGSILIAVIGIGIGSGTLVGAMLPRWETIEAR